MKAVKIVAVLLCIYVGIVVLFESMLGYFQPAYQSTVIIKTLDSDGGNRDRVVAGLESEGQFYVAANHWPRAWYRQVLAQPELQVEVEGVIGDYLAVPVNGTEHDRVDGDNSLPLMFRILTGFPPRYFVRLDPR